MARMGIDYLLKVEDSATPGTYITVGGARGASINMSADEIDVTTKDSAGWREKASSFKSWEVSHDGLILNGNTGFEELMDAYMNGTNVLIQFTYAGAEGTEEYAGECLISSIDLDAGYDAEATYSVALSGTGALSRTTA